MSVGLSYDRSVVGFLPSQGMMTVHWTNLVIFFRLEIIERNMHLAVGLEWERQKEAEGESICKKYSSITLEQESMYKCP